MRESRISGSVEAGGAPDQRNHRRERQKIVDRAFWYYRALTEVTIPAGVEIIGERAFEGCTGLAEVIIPERFRERGGDIFPGTGIFLA